MIRKRLIALTAFAALGTQIAAQQDEALQGPLTTKPHVVIETVGPDGWRMRLGVTNVAAMMTKVKWLFSGSETVDVDGVELRRYGNMLGYDLWMAVGNGVFVIAAGRDAEEEATAVLQKAKGQTFAVTTELAAAHADLKRYLPPGLNGLAQADLASVLAIPSEWWLEALNDVLPFINGPQLDPDEAEEQQQRFHRLLQSNNLALVRSATGFADGRWHWRLFW